MSKEPQTSENPGQYPDPVPLQSDQNARQAEPELSSEVAEKLAKTRVKFAKAMKGVELKNELSPERQEELLKTVEGRFEANIHRHKGMEWAKVQAKLEADPEKMWSLNEMERTGGEPDVVGFDQNTDEYIFNDCSAERPEGRRMICYDREGQKSAEKQGCKPEGNAIEMSKDMGIDVLTEAEYRALQELGKFDLKTVIWLKTPADIRKTGFGLLGLRDHDFVRVDQFLADNHLDDGGFRGSLRV